MLANGPARPTQTQPRKQGQYQAYLRETSKSPRFDPLFEHRIDEEEEKAHSGLGSASRLGGRDSAAGTARVSCEDRGHVTDGFLAEHGKGPLLVHDKRPSEDISQQIEVVHKVKAPPDSADNLQNNQRAKQKNALSR